MLMPHKSAKGREPRCNRLQRAADHVDGMVSEKGASTSFQVQTILSLPTLYPPTWPTSTAQYTDAKGTRELRIWPGAQPRAQQNLGTTLSLGRA